MSDESLNLQALLSDIAIFPLARKTGKQEMLKVAITQALPNGTCCLSGLSVLDPTQNFYLLHDLLRHELRKYAANFPEDINQCIFRVFSPRQPVSDKFLTLPANYPGRQCFACEQSSKCLVCSLLVVLISTGHRLRSLAYHDSASVSRRRFTQCHYANANLNSIWNDDGLSFDEYLNKLSSESTDKQQNLKYQEQAEWSVLIDLAEKGLFPECSQGNVECTACSEQDSQDSLSSDTLYTATGVPSQDCNILHIKHKQTQGWMSDTESVPVTNPREYAGPQTQWENEVLVVPTFLASASDITDQYHACSKLSRWFHPPSVYSFPDGDVILSSEVKVNACGRERDANNMTSLIRDGIKNAVAELLDASERCSGSWDNIVGFMLSGSARTGGLIIRKVVCENTQHLWGWYHGTYKFASPDDVLADQFVEALITPQDDDGDDLMCHDLPEMDSYYHRNHFKDHICDVLDQFVHEFDPRLRRMHLCCQLTPVPVADYHKTRTNGTHTMLRALSSVNACETKWGPFTIFNQWITSGWNKLDALCTGSG